ncbi:hypothetical protein DESC_970002 [Desulfosarcina cetonica]|nr:hypothetical protein DESC_970002 [Desulfosarcina cetonica]
MHHLLRGSTDRHQEKAKPVARQGRKTTGLIGQVPQTSKKLNLSFDDINIAVPKMMVP